MYPSFVKLKTDDVWRCFPTTPATAAILVNALFHVQSTPSTCVSFTSLLCYVVFSNLFIFTQLQYSTSISLFDIHFTNFERLALFVFKCFQEPRLSAAIISNHHLAAFLLIAHSVVMPTVILHEFVSLFVFFSKWQMYQFEMKDLILLHLCISCGNDINAESDNYVILAL